MLAARPPNVILVMPEKALKLTMNDVFRAQFRNLRTNKDLPLPLEMLAGGMAGFCQGTATQPAARGQLGLAQESRLVD